LITFTGNIYINPSPLDNLHRQYIYKPLSSQEERGLYMYCLWRLSRGEGVIYVLPVEVIKRRGVYKHISCGGFLEGRRFYMYST
jgi:hypothetical protein